MGKLLLLAALAAGAIFLWRHAGWIRYAIQQRRRERLFPSRPARHRPRPAEWPADRLTLCWLGHATLLINFHGTRIITDPVFSDSVGIELLGRVLFGPRRITPCPLTPSELPPLDLIVQSHAHLDHLDVRSWKQLPRQAAVVMAAHNARHIRRLGFSAVTELHWGEQTEVAGVRITALEVKHWGERFPWSRWHGYNAYLLERHGRAILFGGDTAYTDTFRQACAGRKIHVAVLPIGGYQPYIHMHASPEQVWTMFQEIGADYLVPIHHQTFILSHEPPDEPLRRLLEVAGSQAHRVAVRDIGQTFQLPA